ncbi:MULTISPECIES: glycosyltransferase family A protein [unclassified Leptolyngbya]|uniref:glycosyltransferase family 2 protein n=1 Tax=unclassified Leptolyngbya TaxID=2650499 RepID=UPI00168904AD|nr:MULTISPECIES: glycosyltransferase family A protein [unclassified Leptolyngbya]MBD1909203.1 glycosyltransferase family 2 protein [Leptolyngbya sp. FACHB-8]MBD2153994.1 glycosyltransferase family 2 protein [Leptolyngbya sp. FACHB-16]
MSTIDVLIPTYNRPTALAVTLTSLSAQTHPDFSIIVSDQSDTCDVADISEIQTIQRVLRSHNHPTQIHKHLPRRGIAEQRQFLLTQATAPYVLYLDDDVILEPWVIQTLLEALQNQGCGFVGNPLIGLSFLDDIRPHEHTALQFWETAVQPEIVRSHTPEWERWRLHNAANPYHIQQKLGITPDNPRLYRINWIGGCVLFDRAKLLDVGGFSFWQDVPATACGEDVLVQRRLMAQYGGCGLLPSGAYHQELPTTLPDRTESASNLLSI